jgi:putative transposase
MNDKFLDTYRISSSRAGWWNYGDAAAYFVTICTQNKECYFGEIIEFSPWDYDKNLTYGLETPCMASLQKLSKTSFSKYMIYSEIGEIVRNEWLKTTECRPDMHITLDEWTVMPDHFHGIIVIGENIFNRMGLDFESGNTGYSRDAMHGVSTNDLPGENRYGPQRKNLSSIIRGFKSAVTIRTRHINPGFAWQERFHDRIIRNNEELNQIRQYILENVENWENDNFH